jgi:hypothetical protein
METEEFKIEIRSPKSTDIFTVIRIIGKMKIKKELLAMSGKITLMNKKNRQLQAEKKKELNTDELEAEVEAIQTELGMEMPLIILENMEKAEEEVEKFFASLIGVTQKEYQVMDADLTIDIFNEIKQHENWVKVFTKALELLGK